MMPDATPPPRHRARAAAGQVLERLLDRALALDPVARAGLRALDARRVQVHLANPDLRFNVRVDGETLRVEAPDEADLRIASTPGALLAMALRSAGAAGVTPGKIQIAGDAELAQRLQHLMSAYAPDFEAELTRHFGDVVGVQMARAMHSLAKSARRFGRDFADDGADWLRDEANLTPDRASVDDFLDAVDALRERADRLDARLQRLESAP